MSERPSPTALALLLGGCFGLAGVAAGAFGAHGLRDSVSARDLEIWQTAAAYQQLHAAVLIACAGLGQLTKPGQLRLIVGLFAIGITVFSGTLYTIVLGGPRWLGAITPLGGLTLMAGWAVLILAGIRRVRG